MSQNVALREIITVVRRIEGKLLIENEVVGGARDSRIRERWWGEKKTIIYNLFSLLGKGKRCEICRKEIFIYQDEY